MLDRFDELLPCYSAWTVLRWQVSPIMCIEMLLLLLLFLLLLLIIIVIIIIIITLQFFDHPIILDLMTERWYGNRRYLESSRPWFLNFWCLFEVVLFPFSFLIAFLLGKV